MPREFLEPVHDLILPDGLPDAGRHGASAEHEDDDGDRRKQQQREGEQERVIEGQHGQADRRVQHEVDARQEEHRGALLHRHHVEEAVHEFGRVHATQRLEIHGGKPEGEIRRESHEDAPLDHLGHDMLQGAQRPRHRQADEEDQRDRGQRLQEGTALRTEGEVADEAVDRQRQRQIQQSRDRTEDRDGPQFAPLGPHQRDQSSDRRHVVHVGPVASVHLMLAHALVEDQPHVDALVSAEHLPQRSAADAPRLRIRLGGAPATGREESVPVEGEPPPCAR